MLTGAYSITRLGTRIEVFAAYGASLGECRKLALVCIPAFLVGSSRPSLLAQEHLPYQGRDMHRVVEPGTFKIMVGGNSVDLIETKLSVVVK